MLCWSWHSVSNTHVMKVDKAGSHKTYTVSIRIIFLNIMGIWLYKTLDCWKLSMNLACFRWCCKCCGPTACKRWMTWQGIEVLDVFGSKSSNRINYALCVINKKVELGAWQGKVESLGSLYLAAGNGKWMYKMGYHCSWSLSSLVSVMDAIVKQLEKQ